MRLSVLIGLLTLAFTLPEYSLAQLKGGKASGSSYSAAATSWTTVGGQTHEFDLNISQASLESYKYGDDNYSDINIYGAYHRMLQSQIQIGGEGGLLSYPDGNSNKTLLALVGTFTYNMDYDLTNSFYGQAGLGILPAYDKATRKFESKFSFMFDFGKRLSIWSHVSYKPFIRIAKRGDMDMEILISALNFSFFW